MNPFNQSEPRLTSVDDSTLNQTSVVSTNPNPKSTLSEKSESKFVYSLANIEKLAPHKRAMAIRARKEDKMKRDKLRRERKARERERLERLEAGRVKKESRFPAIDNDIVLQSREDKLKKLRRFHLLKEQSGNGLLGVDWSMLTRHEELLIDLAIFSMSVIKLETLVDCLPILALLLNKYVRKSSIRCQILHLLEFFRENLSGKLFEQSFSGDLDLNGVNCEKWWSSITDSHVWKDFYKLISYTTCIVVHGFDVNKLKKAKKYVEDTGIMKACEGLKFFSCVSEIIKSVCTRVMQAYHHGSILHFFHSGADYESWLKVTYDLETRFKEAQEKVEYDRFKLLKDLTSAIDQGKEIVTMIKTHDKKESGTKLHSVVQSQIQKMIVLRQQLSSILNSCKLRALPFAMLVAGKSGQGKSGFIDMCHSHFGKLRGLEHHPLYVRNPTDPHWNNFESWCWGILIDDAAVAKPERVIGIDLSLSEIIQIINPVSLQPPRAALEDKGRASVQAQFVCVSTNVPDLYAPLYFSNTAAVYRRLAHRVILEVKPEFRHSVGQGIGLDSNKANHEDDAYPDWWYITVEVPVAQPSGIGQQDDIKETCVFQVAEFEGKKLEKVGIIDFLKWYNFEVNTHFEKQHKMLHSQEKILNIELCETHKLPIGNHECLVEQGYHDPFPEPAPRVVEIKRPWWQRVKDKVYPISFRHFTTCFAAMSLLLLQSMKRDPSRKEISATNSLFEFLYYMTVSILTYLSIALPFAYLAGWLRLVTILGLQCFIYPQEVCRLIFRDNETFPLFLKSMEYFREVAVLVCASYLGDVATMLRTFGDLVRSKLGIDPWIVILVASIGIIVLVMRYMRSTVVEEQGQAMSLGSPFVSRGETKNVYARPRVELDVLDLPKHAMSLNRKKREDVVKFYQGNLFYVGFETNRDEKLFEQGNALFVCGNLALVETHLHNKCEGTSIHSRWIVDPVGGVNKNFDSFIYARDIKPLGQHLSLICVNNTTPKRDLKLSLPPDNFNELVGDGFLMHRKVDGEVTVREAYNIHHVEDMFGTGSAGWIYKTQEPTQVGDCGALLFLESGGGPLLVGFHQYWNVGEKKAGAMDICGLERQIVEVSSRTIKPGSACVEGEKPGKLSVLHEKSVVNTEPGHFPCEVYGCFTGHRAQPKSHLIKTPLAPLLEDDGITCEFTAPDMSWQAVNNQFSKLVRPKFDRRIDVMEMASESLLRFVMRHAKASWYQDCHILDQQSAINGQDGVRFCDALNIKTSAGHPYYESKKKHMYTDTGDWNATRFVDDEIQDEINRIFESYKKKEMSNSVFVASLKDEARKKKKVLEKDTRVFYGGPMAFIIVQRQLYLWFVKLVQSNHFIFMQAPGMDAQGKEWDKLYHWLVDFSPNVIAGDFKAFDVTQDADELMVVYKFIRRFARQLGASKEHLDLMEACEKDTTFPLINYFGTLIRTALNPSGQSLTVIVNGLMNVLRTMSLYALQCDVVNDENMDSFFDNVRLMTYGDDNIMASKVDTFNHSYLQYTYEKMGITYTMADKERETQPFITIEEATFLKRSWRFEPDLDMFVAPLDITSMTKMLYTYIPSKVISTKQQLSQMILTNHQEWFLHGKSAFEEWTEKLKRYAVELDLIDYVSFHSWDYYCERFKNKNIEQARNEPMCEMCSHNCAFVHYSDKGDLRLCSFCRWCRFDEPDLDCLHCQLPDNCETCGSLCEVTPQFYFQMLGNNAKVFSVFCRNCEETTIQVGVRAPEFGPEYGQNQTLQQSVVTGMSDGLVTHRHSEWTDRCNCSKALPKFDFLDQDDGTHQRTTSDNVFDTRHCLKTGIAEQEFYEQKQEIKAEQANNVETNVSEHQTVQFADANLGEIMTFRDTAEQVYTDAQEQIDLGQFLSRPVLISTHSWTTSTFTTASFYPWHLWMTNTAVSKKLANFAFFKGNLKVKIVVNSSPFYYGALLAYYTPLSTSVPGLASTSVDAVTVSQRPHIWIYPQTSSGGEMTLPFFYESNMVSLLSASNIQDLGVLTFKQYTALTSANGATSNGCTIQVYAWCEDAVLGGATSQAILQSKRGKLDEYSNGPISAPASALANWSSYLEKVPVIGKFATATRIGASATSEIAKLFGWSDVPVLEAVQPAQLKPFRGQASAHISSSVEKLTLDPKAEVSVDPSIIGLNSDDELAITSIVGRESFVTSNTWATTDAVGTQVLVLGVTPMLYDRGIVSSAGTYGIAMTPMCMVSRMFEYWRGDIIFRFKIICSRFHQGRLRISWDPVGSNSASTDTSNVLLTKVVDLAVSDEVEFRIPYMQARSWSTTYRDVGDIYTANNFGTTGSLTYKANGNNGELTVKCLTNLSAPVDTASVTILAFVRAAENFQVAVPAKLPDTFSHIVMQSKEETMPGETQVMTPWREMYLQNFGEAVISLRPLMRRYQYVFANTGYFNGPSYILDINYVKLPRTPFPPGYSTDGFTSVLGVEAPGTFFPFNPCHMTTYGWVSPSFMGYRGSTRWRVTSSSNNSNGKQVIQVLRKSETHASSLVGTANVAPRTGSIEKIWAGTSNDTAGKAISTLMVDPVLEFECPSLTPHKFYRTKPTYINVGTSRDGTDYEYYEIKSIISGYGSAVDLIDSFYFSVGTDFNLHLFLSVPVLYYNADMGRP